MKFIDLFAGLGGFHVALKRLGHECVFASEIKKELRDLYYDNFDIMPDGDITSINENDIPKHDILCAGFPCQPFSKAGKQNGLNDEENGKFINDIKRIIEFHQPTYFILENVPHLRRHDNENTWKQLQKIFLQDLGYSIEEKILSPNEFGIPQIRKRLFIVGCQNGLDHFIWPQVSLTSTNIKNILDESPKDAVYLNDSQKECLSLWQSLLDSIPKDARVPLPLWSTEFKATYPYKEIPPYMIDSINLGKSLGTFGKSLKGLEKKDQLGNIPSYAREEKSFPVWKKRFIKNSRRFYYHHASILNDYIKELKKFKFSWQKFEWNCGNSKKIINEYLIQFRPSGIRIKKTNYAPSLVQATTQIPIIGWEQRYITKFEAAKLQSLQNIKLPESDNFAFKTLGNAVNAEIVYRIAENLIKQDKLILSKSA